ncbi:MULTISPECIES: FxsA family protein [Neisseria]|uniref:FxsA cytoplasmic membrane family protein n=1 Tax=Neisseria musculi TaxID=1815583 RepID=A0A7H1MDN6_9NEIS|nr:MULTISPECIES: FxsA family protein [Neisseria]MBF0804861.1 FxsA family protein [Neisseria sp. 19428wB4_WF04]QNT59751.1 fxsA cytoplasmic membrane family protein [Neisseria musculi]TFU39432.1 membrane protein FxsA [Neisseria sp. WF04]
MRFFGIGFLVLLFLEIMSIVWVADWLGGGIALALMILSFMAGVMMLRHTGLSGVLLAGAAMRSGNGISLYQMLWPIRYAVAALLLMSPGFVSLAIALILLLPVKGKPIAQMNTTGGTFGSADNPFRRTPGGSGDIIEGEYTVTEPSEKPKQDYIEHKPD